MKIIGLSGSLREHSVNTALLRAAGELSNASLDVYDYREVPFYNSDIEVPSSVHRLREAISAADAVLLAVPEYNYSVPGVLKNAVDWASRPAYQSPFRDKPVGVVSAAASFVGGARGQQHMKNILLGMGAAVFPWPELLVGGAKGKFIDGKLVDEQTRTFLRAYMDGLTAWAARVQAAAAA